MPSIPCTSLLKSVKQFWAGSCSLFIILGSGWPVAAEAPVPLTPNISTEQSLTKGSLQEPVLMMEIEYRQDEDEVPKTSSSPLMVVQEESGNKRNNTHTSADIIYRHEEPESPKLEPNPQETPAVYRPSTPAGQYLEPIMYLPSTIQKSQQLIDLQTLIETIAHQNLDIAMAEARIKKSRGEFIGTMAPLFPSFTAENSIESYKGGQVFFSGAPLAVERVTHAPRFTFSHDLHLGGRPIFDLKISKHQLERAKLERDRIFQASLMEGMRAYFNLMFQQSAMTTSQRLLDSVEKQRQIDAKRFDLGFITRQTLDDTLVEVSQKKVDLEEARYQSHLAKVSMALLMNVPLTWELAIREDVLGPVSFVEESWTLEDYLQSARTERADVQELERQIKEAKLAYWSSWTDLLPTVSVSGYRGGLGPYMTELSRVKQIRYSTSFDVMRNMGVGAIGAIKTAHAKKAEAILNKEKALGEIYKKVAENYHQVEHFRRLVSLDEEKLFAAQESHRIAQAQLEAGKVSERDVLQRELALAEVNNSFHSTVLNFNMAQLVLLFESGQLNSERILTPVHSQVASHPFK
ncbi:MAG: TolC family protein [Vampirovibrio sp.]|nr:TolC family protein [Vampirovibrio sp.]